jgi:hypothetical protein
MRCWPNIILPRATRSARTATPVQDLRENKSSYRRLSLRERALFRGAKGDTERTALSRSQALPRVPE